MTPHEPQTGVEDRRDLRRRRQPGETDVDTEARRRPAEARQQRPRPGVLRRLRRCCLLVPRLPQCADRVRGALLHTVPLLHPRSHRALLLHVRPHVRAEPVGLQRQPRHDQLAADKLRRVRPRLHAGHPLLLRRDARRDIRRGAGRRFILWFGGGLGPDAGRRRPERVHG